MARVEVMIEKIDTTVFDRKKERILDSIGYLVEGKAIRHCPVVTGRLRASITHKVTGKNEVMIGTIGTPYASFVEYGTNVMINAHGPHEPLAPVTSWEAQRKRGATGQTMPFIRNSVFEAEPEILALFKKEFK